MIDFFYFEAVEISIQTDNANNSVSKISGFYFILLACLMLNLLMLCEVMVWPIVIFMILTLLFEEKIQWILVYQTLEMNLLYEYFVTAYTWLLLLFLSAMAFMAKFCVHFWYIFMAYPLMSQYMLVLQMMELSLMYSPFTYTNKSFLITLEYTSLLLNSSMMCLEMVQYLCGISLMMCTTFYLVRLIWKFLVKITMMK